MVFTFETTCSNLNVITCEAMLQRNSRGCAPKWSPSVSQSKGQLFGTYSRGDGHFLSVETSPRHFVMTTWCASSSWLAITSWCLLPMHAVFECMDNSFGKNSQHIWRESSSWVSLYYKVLADHRMNMTTEAGIRNAPTTTYWIMMHTILLCRHSSMYIAGIL